VTVVDGTRPGGRVGDRTSGEDERLKRILDPYKTLWGRLTREKKGLVILSWVLFSPGRRALLTWNAESGAERGFLTQETNLQRIDEECKTLPE